MTFRCWRRLAGVFLTLMATLASVAGAAEFSFAQRLHLQQALAAKGFDVEGADGTFGPRTKAAIAAYQKSIGNASTGALTPAEADVLLAGYAAAESFEILENADLPGNDYRMGIGKGADPGLKNIDLAQCVSTCAAEGQCRAFTYNVSARVCFLKSSGVGVVDFDGAVSGRRSGEGVGSGWRTDPGAILAWVKRSLSKFSRSEGAKLVEKAIRGERVYREFEDFSSAERDYLIAVDIAEVLDNRFYDSNAGIGNGTIALGELYLAGMFDVADDLTAALADSEVFKMGLWNEYHSPGSASWVVGNMALGSRDYELATIALTHALKNTPLGSNDKFRIELLRMLMQAYDESGEYARASEVARNAVAMIQSGAATVDESLGKAFAELAVAGQGGAIRGAARIAGIAEAFRVELETACAAEDSGLLPAIPAELSAADQSAMEALEAIAPRFVECATPRFARNALNNYPFLTTYKHESFADSYFLTLAVAGDVATIDQLVTEFVRQGNIAETVGTEELERLVSIDEATHLSPEKRAQFGREILLNTRFDWALRLVTQLHSLGKEDAATHMLDRMTSEFSPEIIRRKSHRDQKSTFLVEIYALKGPDRFLELLSLSPPRPKTEHCRMESCEIEILAARAEGRIEDIDDQQHWLEVAYVIMGSGAGADPTEMDGIKEGAVAEAARYSRLGLDDIAEGYFRIAGVTPQTILADDNPIDALDDISAADAYIETLTLKGDRATANRLARHIVEATRKGAETGATFSEDAIMRWAPRLGQIFRNYLSTLNWSETGELEGDAELALFAIQFLQMSPTATTITRLGARMQGANSDLIKAQQDLSRKLADAYAELALAKGGADALLAEVRTLEADRRAVDAKLLIEEPRYASYARSNFSSASSLTAALKADEAVWIGLLLDDALYLAWFDRDGLTIRRETTTLNYRALIAQYRAAMVGEPRIPDLPLGAGYTLYQRLLAPFEARRDGLQRLILIPSGGLDAVPFAALPTSKPEKDTLTAAEVLGRPQPWLVRDVAMTTLPSLASLEILRRGEKRTAANRPFFGLGDPTYGARESFDLPSLPETGAEVRYLAALLGSGDGDLLLGAAATEERLTNADLGSYRILDFATHGFIAGGISGLSEPALAVAADDGSDGMLTASEILGWNLNADLVILSACNTASSDGTPGAEGLSGLANSFFYAGARNLIVTHWSIPSAPAVDIVANMITLYEDAPDLGYSVALQRSVLAMIDNPPSELAAHPVSWAGQFVVGAN